VNPPGEEYETCARFIGDTLKRFDFDVQYVAAEGHRITPPRIRAST
jgi:succinyl-diaminopimelate desuccinylase